MKKLTGIILIVFSLNVYSQDTLSGKCWTPEMDTTAFQNLPWYDNNIFLENFLDSIGYPAAGSSSRIIGSPEVKFWIPIKFWVYRDDNGIGGPNISQIQTLMDDLNRRFNQTNYAMIGFYMKCDPSYVNSSTHVTKTFTGASLLMAANNDPGSINVHIIGNFNSANTAGFSIPFLNAGMIPSGSYTNPNANGDLAHEIGHILGLSHTHQYSAWNWKCLTECVSRSRTWPTFNLCLLNRIKSKRVCESTGDALKDTPADDNLVSNNSCAYNVNLGNDEWADSYDNPPNLADRPDITNIMSYNSATNCVDHFSRLQIAAMLYTLYYKKPNNVAGWSNSISTFDNYEPDNVATTGRNINLGEAQERNFHQQWNKNAASSWFSQCDVDWVRFSPTCSGAFDILTSAIPGKTNANTRLTLFSSNGTTQLAQNDNISAGNFFSSITWNFIAGQTYFIRVENMTNLVTGYYRLQVGPALTITSATTNICQPVTFTVTKPANASVTWSASPGGIVSFNPAGPTTIATTSVSRITNGVATITATLSGCSATPISISQSVSTGVLKPGPISWSWNVPPNRVLLDVVDVPGATSYQWYLESALKATTTNSYYQLPMSGNVSCGNFYYFGVKAVNSCGVSDMSYIGADMPPCDFAYTVSPNPGLVNITIQSNSVDAASLAKTSTSQIQEIEIFDKMGVIRKKQKFAKGLTVATVSVSALTSDVYTLRIFNGQIWQSTKIIVQH